MGKKECGAKDHKTESKDRPCELPFIRLVSLFTRFVTLPMSPGCHKSSKPSPYKKIQQLLLARFQDLNLESSSSPGPL